MWPGYDSEKLCMFYTVTRKIEAPLVVGIRFSELPFTSVSKRNLSYENEFYSHVPSNANQTHFHMKGLALGLVLKQRQKATRKWPIVI